MSTFWLGIILGFIGGNLFYRYLLDTPETMIKTNKVKQKGTVDSQQSMNVDQPKKRRRFLGISLRRKNKQK